jgi:hypothetical protein
MPDKTCNIPTTKNDIKSCIGSLRLDLLRKTKCILFGKGSLPAMYFFILLAIKHHRAPVGRDAIFTNDITRCCWKPVMSPLQTSVSEVLCNMQNMPNMTFGETTNSKGLKNKD